MAGIGVASFRYGSQGDNVVELDVVTGRRRRRHLLARENDDLFWGAIAGLGSFGIITRARLKLRRMKPMTRTYYLLYDDLRVFLEDARSRWTAAGGTTSNRGGAVRPGDATGRRGAPGLREVVLPVPPHGRVRRRESSRRRGDARAGCARYDNLYTDDCPTIEFLERMVPVFALWKKAGTWEFMHPWIECILPWETAADCIEQVLAGHAAGIQLGGHVLLWPAKGTTSRSKNFMVPGGENLVGFGLLPGGPAEVLGRDERAAGERQPDDARCSARSGTCRAG